MLGIGAAMLVATHLPLMAQAVSAPRFHLEEATIADVHRALRAKEITAEQLVQLYFKRIGAYNGTCVKGEVDPAKGLTLARHLLEAGCYQVSLGDTIGVGTPVQTQQILELFTSELPVEKLALHLHDTRGTALANVLVGLQMGVTTFDASVAGLGGCPYAPGAAGNLATEDLVYSLHGMGIETGIDLDKLWQAGQVAEAIVGRDLPGKVHRAGVRSLAK